MTKGDNINKYLRRCSDHRDQLFCLFELKKLPWPYGWSLGCATKRIRLKLTLYKHHLLNYTFFKENYYIPSSLYPSLPPFHTANEKFYRRWRYISHSAAYRHLKLLITECRHKIKELTKELSRHMELLRNSCSPYTFLFYTTKLDSMASSLESLLAHRRAKKAARFRGIIDHHITDNSLNQQVTNTNAITNDIPSNVTHNASTSTATRKRSRRKTKPANIPLDNSSVINLSSCSLSTDEISILSRGLTFCLRLWQDEDRSYEKV